MKKKTNVLLVIIWMTLIFIMSSFNSTESSNQSNYIVDFISNIFNINNIELLSFIIRKMAHFTEYLILGILVYNVVNSYNKEIYIAIFISVGYAITDELHQIFVPGRSCQILDVIIDSSGSIIGIYLLKTLKKLIII